jgi:hypothetical protein
MPHSFPTRRSSDLLQKKNTRLWTNGNTLVLNTGTYTYNAYLLYRYWYDEHDWVKTDTVQYKFVNNGLTMSDFGGNVFQFKP